MHRNNSRYESIEVPVNKQFQHDLSHTHITSMDFFRLHPLLCQEVIPGGKYSIDLRAIVSSAPLATQVYGGCHLDMHAFFVPYRIIYENWNAYYAGNDRSISSYESLPYVTGFGLSSICGSTNGQESSNNSYKEIRRVFGALGYPTFSASNLNISTMRYSLLFARAYQQVWWDYYRDSVNIPESVKSQYLDTDGGEMGLSPFVVRYRTFKKDFVSTLLASPQLGGVSSARVSTALGPVVSLSNGSNYNQLFNSVTGPFTASLSAGAVGTTSTSLVNSVSTSVLRGAIAMQRYLERLNVTGTRPMERLFSLLGAKPSPERLDMAELLGGKTIRVNIDGLVNSGSNEQLVSGSAVTATLNAWGIDNDSAEFGNFFGQGYQTGYASGSGQTDKINYTASEHGVLLVIGSLVPEYINPNVVPRGLIRGLSTPDASREDFFIEDLDGLGYDETLLCEVATPSSFDVAFNTDTWASDFNPYNVVGYRPKYEDYRYVANRISGDFQEKDSARALRNLAFTLSYPEVLDVREVQAGLQLTTSNFAYRALFDKHFQIADESVDHFIVYLSVVNDASLPLSGNQLPTELSDLANSESLLISNGGVRL